MRFADAGSSEWWRDAVVYQVYLKSFSDSDGDGVGDLDGVTARLDHLVRLGVDGLWLNPCYPSPGRDGGYDVADFLRVDDVYGGTPALDRLLAAAHERGLRVLMDVVPNHCSVEHAWFQQALGEPAGGPYRERFLFRDGRDGGSAPPNNWRSVFGGPAWTRVADGQWYLHSFDSSQPDFNWRRPEVREYFEAVLRHWFDRGVDGFRIDVAAMLVKAEGLPDEEPGAASPNGNQPEVHDIYRGWRALAGGYPGERAFVGEVWAPTARDVAAFARADELQQVFYFDLMLQPWHAGSFRTSVERGLAAIAAAAGTLAWALNSHDAHRSVSRYGLLAAAGAGPGEVMGPALRTRGDVDVHIGQLRARAALLFLLGLPGGVFLYQGEELGLPEVMDLPDAARQDPIWFRSGGAEHGRDGCRVPLPWAAGEPGLGFSTGVPWLPQPDWFAGYAADAQETAPDSTLSLYRAALGRRRLLFGADPLVWLETDREDVIAYRRGTTVVATVFGPLPWAVPAGWGVVVQSSTGEADDVLAGPVCVWLRR